MRGSHRLSLRATLLFGYALGLCLVLGVFGVTAQTLYWRTLVRNLDAELASRARSLAGGVRVDVEGRFDIETPDDLLAFFAEHRDAYFVVWREDGEMVDFTAPDLAVPHMSAPGARTRDDRREVATPGPRGTVLLVGRALGAQGEQYREFVQTLRTAGAAALLIAIGSAWLFVRRALAPIDRIGETAAAMSVENLALRIDVGRTESELGRIALALNAAFDRLQAAFDRQTRFTADASHELRTPLATIYSESEWALRRERTVGEYQHAFGTCLRAARRMRAVVEGLLTLARADAANTTFAREPVDLAGVAQEVLRATNAQARASAVVCSASLAPAVVLGDGDRLRELVQNLVQNAVQYNRPGGLVHVSTTCREGVIALEVRDTGPGVPPAVQPHVFERFYRGDAARTGPAGSGLGLAIAKWIAEEHGGTIACTSAPEEGTTFTVRLPAPPLPRRASAGPEEPDIARQPPAGEPLTPGRRPTSHA